ncbi:MAG: S-methyl-5-thioribose-1-phosphate isomerase [Deltaproteobacteria bacterium]|nr:S-methyl-5-thioribose-1-phosphate isomerase [Deltaproteobacteria bacterium]MDQ3296741.1 S-methyl-5-thioribose-1-phosphate isomerase [Myxococcota bacterium]
MNVDGRWRRTIEVRDPGTVIVLDQAKLPHEVSWLALDDLDATAHAIREMHVRGAPLIGATAAHGVALALRGGRSLDEACTMLAASRPTAINLRWALDHMRLRIAEVPADTQVDVADAEAARICDADVACCEAIGDHGVALIRAVAERHGGRPVQVLTHCNAGWLATVDWGTALAPIYKAHEAGIAVHVWVDETRPRNQGLLTAWELAQHGVPHTVIADNAGGHLMQQGKVDLCLVGTDRTTRNGDVCNKIGTYLKALAAHDNGVPFYAAVPSSSIDWTVGEPSEIPIEERAGDELRYLAGRGDRGGTTRIAILAGTTAVGNPAFDVTPRRLMTGLVTERGITSATAAGLAALFPEHAADHAAARDPDAGRPERGKDRR